MAETLTNVTIGKGKLYLAPVGTALPTITGTLGDEITWTNWNDPGFMSKDIEIKISEDVEDFTPRGYLTPIASAIKAKKATGKFTLAEADADALAIVLNNGTLDAATLSDGGDSTDVSYTAIAIETDLMVYHFKKVHIKGDTTIKLEDAGFIELPCEFTAYAKPDDTAGERVYKFHERTAGA